MTPEEIQAKIDEAVEAATAGLKTKNTELLGEVKKLKKGATVDPAEVEKLENQIDELKTQLSTADKAAKKAAKELETAQNQLKAESGFTEKLLKQDGLRAQLVDAKVAPQYMDAALALLSPQVQIVADGENRVAKVGDKPVADFVKAWVSTDQGKHFVAAAGNTGGGASGGAKGGEGAKTMTREQFQSATPEARVSFSKAGGVLTD